jgi:hypothetical protein
MATKLDTMRPIMPRWGESSVNPEGARRKAEERRSAKHNPKRKKKKKGK